MFSLTTGRSVGATIDRRVHSRRGEIVSMRELANDQRQAGANSTVATERRGFRAGRFDAAGSTKDGVRRWCSTAVESRRVGDDHGSTLRRRVLRRYRYRSGAQVSERSRQGRFQ